MNLFQRKNLYYELKYLSYKFKPHNLLLFLFTLIASVIVSIGDTQAFFIGNTSPIPEKWTFFKKSSNVKVISILVIVIPAISLFITEGINSKKEANNISDITYEVTFPFFEEDLNKLHTDLLNNYQLSDTSRIYILIPVRQNFCQWNLKIIARTKNFNNRENEISLALDEGVIGYEFQKMQYNNKNEARYISFGCVSDVPPNFRNYNENNKQLIRPDNQGYLILPIFDNKFLSSLLVIDTNQQQDLENLQKGKFHEDIFNWIGSEPIFLTLVWKLINNHGYKQ